MKILRLIRYMIASEFYSWALREINPLHPDMPRIVLRKREIDDQLKTF